MVAFADSDTVNVLADEELPLVLPELEDYKGHNGKAPLENATEWKNYDNNGVKGKEISEISSFCSVLMPVGVDINIIKTIFFK